MSRLLIGDRLDITGARWGLQGAEAVLTLRAVISNGDFDDYWRFHLAREHQRLYPGTPQSQSLRVALPLTPNEPHPTAKPHPLSVTCSLKEPHPTSSGPLGPRPG